MTNKIFILMLLVFSFLISSCTPDEDDPVSSVSANCEKNTDCKRDEFCDFKNPVFDDATGTKSYKCTKRDSCISKADCQFSWVCCKAEHFCVTEDEFALFGSACDEVQDTVQPDNGNNDEDSTVLPDNQNKTDNVQNDNDSVEVPDVDTDSDTTQEKPDQDEISGTPVFTEGFENGSSKWAMDGVWQVGNPSSGPNTARTGSNVVATNLSADYPANCNSRLTYLDPISINSKSKLVFYAYVDTEYNLYDPSDYLEIQVKTDSGTWLEDKVKLSVDISNPHKLIDMGNTKINGHVDENYHRFIADLSYFNGKTVTFSFLFKSDDSTFASGIYIDDISLY